MHNCKECKRIVLSTQDYKRGLCGACYQRWLYKNNPHFREKQKAYSRRYSKLHRKECSIKTNLYQRNNAIPLIIREEVILRAKGICERCGGITKMMNIHHKDKLSNPRGLKNGKANNSPDNLEYLCLRCHIKEHKPRGQAQDYLALFADEAAEGSN